MKKTILTLLLISVSSVGNASELTHKFANPSFSGQGFGAHVLGIEQDLLKRKKAIEDEKKAEAIRVQRELENTNLSKFFKNVEARIYAELSKKLVDNLFGEDAQDTGTVTIEGNTITYYRTETDITLNVVNDTGQVTTIVIPIGSFNF